MTKSFVEKVALGVNRYGFPVAQITTSHSNFHFQQTAKEDCVVVKIMEMEAPRRCEKVKIPHVFRSFAWGIFSKEKDQLHAFVVPFGFFEIKHENAVSVREMYDNCKSQGIDPDIRKIKVKEFQDTVRATYREFHKEYMEECNE